MVEGNPMPAHDWTRVEAGIFHHFHHGWTAALSNALNSGVLPPGYFALSEQVISGPVPDVLTLQQFPDNRSPNTGGGTAVTTAPPQARFIQRATATHYARLADRVAVRHSQGKIIAVIEIVSPGNKDSRNALRAFVRKAARLLRQGIHLLVVDLFPPGKRDPEGIHKAIWEEIRDEPFTLPPDKPLTMAAYDAGPEIVAYVEPVAVGDALPNLPLFLEPELYVPAPLEATYQATWNVFPAALKGLLEGVTKE
jgi:hypothetical protein